MNQKLSDVDQVVVLAIKKYFKANKISHKIAAERLGITSQAVTNRLFLGKFTPTSAASWNKAFGFNEHFLVEGKGTLIKRSRGYQKIVKENDSLHAIIRALKAQNSHLQEEVAVLKAQLQSINEQQINKQQNE